MLIDTLKLYMVGVHFTKEGLQSFIINAPDIFSYFDDYFNPELEKTDVLNEPAFIVYGGIYQCETTKSIIHVTLPEPMTSFVNQADSDVYDSSMSEIEECILTEFAQLPKEETENESELESSAEST